SGGRDPAQDLRGPGHGQGRGLHDRGRRRPPPPRRRTLPPGRPTRRLRPGRGLAPARSRPASRPGDGGPVPGGGALLLGPGRARVRSPVPGGGRGRSLSPAARGGGLMAAPSLLPRLPPTRSEDASLQGWPLVTVAIPCLNEEAFIESCIRGVQAQDYPSRRLEILVADGGSTDATKSLLARLAREDPRIRTLDNPARIQPPG